MSERKTRAGWLIAASGLMTVPAASGAAAGDPTSGTGEPLPARTAPAEALTTGPGASSRLVVTHGRGSGASPCASVPTRVEAAGDLAAAARAEERHRHEVPASGALAVEVPSVSSLVVRDGVSSRLELTLCKRAWASSDEEAESILSEVSLHRDGDHLRAAGPADSPRGTWAADLILEVPEGLVLDLYTDRGSITLRGTTRDVRARSRHGGIFAAPSGGTVALESENGSIHLRLEGGASWEGRGVAATSRNGSVHAHLPSPSPFAAISAESRFGQIHTDSKTLRQQIDAETPESPETPHLALATVNGPLYLITGD